MSASVVLITGANTGLGLEVVKALAGSGKAYKIILASRSLEKAQTAIKDVKAEFSSTSSTFDSVQVDLESDDSISKAFEKISASYGHIDVLVNNGGATFDRHILDGSMTTRQVWNKAWDVNVAGTQVFTQTFVPLLLKSSNNPRLIFLTTGMSSLEETFNTNFMYNKSPGAGWPKQPLTFAAVSYRATKTGLNMAFREWARILKDDGVKVFGVAPGFLATGLGGNKELNKKMGAGDPAVAGTLINAVINGERDADEGKTVRPQGVTPW